MKASLVFLTCANKKEATIISRVLLKKRLIVCAKTLPVASAFRWKGKIDEAREVLLLMETAEEKFAEIEREVRKLHSYEQFVLFSVPVKRVADGVMKWMKEELQR